MRKKEGWSVETLPLGLATVSDLQQIPVSQIPAFRQGVEKSPTAEATPQEASCRQLLEKGDWMEEAQPRTRKQEAEAASTLYTHTIASDGRGLCGLEVFPCLGCLRSQEPDTIFPHYGRKERRGRGPHMHRNLFYCGRNDGEGSMRAHELSSCHPVCFPDTLETVQSRENPSRQLQPGSRNTSRAAVSRLHSQLTSGREKVSAKENLNPHSGVGDFVHPSRGEWVSGWIRHSPTPHLSLTPLKATAAFHCFLGVPHFQRVLNCGFSC